MPYAPPLFYVYSRGPGGGTRREHFRGTEPECYAWQRDRAGDGRNYYLATLESRRVNVLDISL